MSLHRIFTILPLSLAGLFWSVVPVAGQQSGSATPATSAEQGQTTLRDSFSGELEDAVKRTDDDTTHFRYRFRSF